MKTWFKKAAPKAALLVPLAFVIGCPSIQKHASEDCKKLFNDQTGATPLVLACQRGTEFALDEIYTKQATADVSLGRFRSGYRAAVKKCTEVAGFVDKEKMACVDGVDLYSQEMALQADVTNLNTDVALDMSYYAKNTFDSIYDDLSDEKWFFVLRHRSVRPDLYPGIRRDFYYGRENVSTASLTFLPALRKNKGIEMYGPKRAALMGEKEENVELQIAAGRKSLTAKTTDSSSPIIFVVTAPQQPTVIDTTPRRSSTTSSGWGWGWTSSSSSGSGSSTRRSTPSRPSTDSSGSGWGSIFSGSGSSSSGSSSSGRSSSTFGGRSGGSSSKNWGGSGSSSSGSSGRSSSTFGGSSSGSRNWGGGSSSSSGSSGRSSSSFGGNSGGSSSRNWGGGSSSSGSSRSSGGGSSSRSFGGGGKR